MWFVYYKENTLRGITEKWAGTRVRLRAADQHKIQMRVHAHIWYPEKKKKKKKNY